MKPSPNKRILIASIVLVSLVILPITLIGPCVMRSLEVPKIQRLAPIDSEEIHFTATLPPGNYFNFLVAVPKGQTLGAPVKGFVSIKEGGHVVIECPIGADTIEEFGNLGEDGSQRYHIWWPENTGRATKGILRGRHTYNFVIRFSSMPPEGSSLWMSRLQKRSD